MGTAAKMARAQEAVQKAATLAEAQAVLDELVAAEQEVTDIFFMQEFTIEKLTDLLESQEQQAPQPIYTSPSAPQPKAPNYILYIGIGLLVLFIFRGRIKI